MKTPGQRLDTEKIPHEFHLEIGADRGTGYRNVANFITMLYLIAAPLGDLSVM